MVYDILYHVISVMRRSFQVCFHVYVGCLLDIGRILICLWTSMELLQIEVAYMYVNDTIQIISHYRAQLIYVIHTYMYV